MTFDMWQNMNGPMPGGGNGSTQHTTAGFGADEVNGTVNNVAPGSIFRSILFSASGDGGTAADYRCYLGNAGFTGTPPVQTVSAGAAQPNNQVSPDNIPVYVAGLATVRRLDGQHKRLLHRRHATPGVRRDRGARRTDRAFPQQTGNNAAGVQSLTWHTWTIAKNGNIVDLEYRR